MKQFLANHLKNVQGWKTKRKLLAFAVDDYGNVRLASLKARQNLLDCGVKLKGRFDYFDALDTREDFEMLYDVLGAVKDKNERHAIFTTYALPCNIDFENTLKNGIYIPENLDKTYERMASFFPDSYNGAFELLKIGIKESFLKPQFHGREHLNVQLFNKLIECNDKYLFANLKNLSLAGLPSHQEFKNISFSQAFAFNNISQTHQHPFILNDGLEKFVEVYGYNSTTFTPPSQEFFTENYKLWNNWNS